MAHCGAELVQMSVVEAEAKQIESNGFEICLQNGLWKEAYADVYPPATHSLPKNSAPWLET